MSGAQGRYSPQRVDELEQELGILGRYRDLWTGVLERLDARASVKQADEKEAT